MRLSFCHLETKQNSHDPREAQSRSENTCVPTLKQHVNYQERSQILLGWLVVLDVTTVGKLAIPAEIAPRNVPKHLEETLVRTVSFDLEPATTADVLSAHESHVEKLVREERLDDGKRDINQIFKNETKVMIIHDYLPWILILNHSSGVSVSECGQEHILLLLIKTVGMKATVSVCTPCNVVSTRVNFDKM